MFRLPLTAVALAALGFLSACNEEPTAVRGLHQPDAASLAKSPIAALTIVGQRWKSPLAAPITASVTVTRTRGAVLLLPELGVSVTIPARAVEVPTTISITALPGSVVAFDFQPAGTKFKAPLRVQQHLGLTQWMGVPFDVVYFKSKSDVGEDGKVKAGEIIPVSTVGAMASFDVWHFSGYAVAAGKQ